MRTAAVLVLCGSALLDACTPTGASVSDSGQPIDDVGAADSGVITPRDAGPQCLRFYGDTIIRSGGCEILRQASGETTLETDPLSGYERCENGRIQRMTAASCEFCFEIETCRLGASACGECPDGELCAHYPDGECRCHQPCRFSEDCKDDEECVCPSGLPGEHSATGSPYPECVPASCVDTGACQQGMMCVLSLASCGLPERLDCESPPDECIGPAECRDGSACMFSVDAGHFACMGERSCVLSSTTSRGR
jgi:hypothetical protein